MREWYPHLTLIGMSYESKKKMLIFSATLGHFL